MEDNKYFYEAEYKSLSGRVSSLQLQLRKKEEHIKQQDMLMEEMYKLLYYKRAWLTLSDENIRGMQKVVGKIPAAISGAQNVMPKTSDEYDQEGDGSGESDDNEPWGV
jgi:hypothetical protein